MSKIFKISAAILSTLAVASVSAQCGPNGCSWQNGGYDYNGYDQGYTGGGYYDHGSQGDYYHGYEGGRGQAQGWDTYYQNKAMKHASSGAAMQPGQMGGEEIHGYDHPMDDHPVYDANGHQVMSNQPAPSMHAGVNPANLPNSTQTPAPQTKLRLAETSGWNYNVADAQGGSDGGRTTGMTNHTTPSNGSTR